MQGRIQTALHALSKAVKIASLTLFQIFPRYLPTYCSLLCFSAFDRHVGNHRLANNGADCVWSKSIVSQKFVNMKVSCIVLQCSASNVRSWKTIVRRSETIIRRSEAIVLHLKL